MFLLRLRSIQLRPQTWRDVPILIRSGLGLNTVSLVFTV